MKVWVNGTFDILHIGHIRMLQYAATLGVLKVGIDSDERVKSLKGVSRPFNRVEDRIELLRSLKTVDEVVSFNTEDELISLIRDWSPDYMVIGSDYKNKTVLGRDYIKQIIFFDIVDGYSTTNILKHYAND